MKTYEIAGAGTTIRVTSDDGVNLRTAAERENGWPHDWTLRDGVLYFQGSRARSTIRETAGIRATAEEMRGQP